MEVLNRHIGFRVQGLGCPKIRGTTLGVLILKGNSKVDLTLKIPPSIIKYQRRNTIIIPATSTKTPNSVFQNCNDFN